MSSSIKVLNQNRSEFNFSKISVNSNYNIVIHCVYDLVNHFDDELGFLNDPALDSNTLVILWHAVEQGVWNPVWINKLNNILQNSFFKLVYVTGCSHLINLKDFYNIKFDVKFMPVFDIRSKELFNFSPVVVSPYKNNRYMFINAADAVHRRYILGMLQEHNLIESGIVSYQCCRGKIAVERDFTKDRGFTKSQLTTAEILFNITDPIVPIMIDDSSVASRLPRKLFLDSYLGIVGETHFVNMPNSFNNTFVTEKTFNTIANNQMFIVVGHAGSLDLLRSIGYKTFNGIIDESYDTILDNGLRIEAVSNEIIRFVSRPINQVKEDYTKAIDIIKYNRNRLFSQSLESRMQMLIDQIKL
jgi:hypothetical protein